MTRDADNDNSSGAAARQQAHAEEHVQSWQGLSHGNAALADQPEPHIADQILEDEVDLDIATAESAPTSEAVSPPNLPETSALDTSLPESSLPETSVPETSVREPSLTETIIAETGVAGTQVDLATGSIPTSNAIPIRALGISIPQRPIPAARQTEIQVRAPQRQVRRRQRPVDLGKQGSEHLFNLPPRPEPPQAEPSPMEQAINAKPRSPLTSQPGFLAGLVAALVSGGAIYGYLVF